MCWLNAQKSPLNWPHKFRRFLKLAEETPKHAIFAKRSVRHPTSNPLAVLWQRQGSLSIPLPYPCSTGSAQQENFYMKCSLYFGFFVCLSVCLPACIPVCQFMYVCIRTYVCTYVRMCLYVCMCVCMHEWRMDACMHDACMRAFVHVSMPCIHASSHTCMHVVCVLYALCMHDACCMHLCNACV